MPADNADARRLISLCDPTNKGRFANRPYTAQPPLVQLCHFHLIQRLFTLAPVGHHTIEQGVVGAAVVVFFEVA